MRNAEKVTFSGQGGLDRLGNLRNDPKAVAKIQSSPSSCVLLLWRGKLLVRAQGEEVQSLVGVEISADSFWREYTDELILIGEAMGRTWFAADVSKWEPDQPAETIGAFHDPSRQAHPAVPDAEFAEIRVVMAMLEPAEAEIAASAKAILGWHENHCFCAKCGSASNVAAAGWQRICPTCKTPHFPRTDPVVIMLITHKEDLLLGRSPGWPDGMYSLLAGFVEPGETIEAAVRREVHEESAVRVGPVRYLASQPWPFPSSLMIGCHGEAQTTEIEVDPNELEDAIWISKDELAEVFAGNSDRIAPARKGSIAQFLMQNWLADSLD